MTYVLDTNVVIALQNDRPKQVRSIFESHAERQAEIFVPTIVAFELWFGVAKSGRYAINVQKLTRFLNDSSIAVLPFDAEDSRVAGHLRATLEKRGTPLGSYDLLIAAQALRREATLVTSNTREFRRVDGLTLEDWALPAAV